MDRIVLTTKPDKNSLPGFYEPAKSIKLKNIEIETFAPFKPDEAFVIKNILSKEECDLLIQHMNTSDNFENVGVQGMIDKKDDRIGSIRTSMWDPELAEQIWNKINTLLPIVTGDNDRATDWWQGLPTEMLYNPITEYKPVAISPLLRFMRYDRAGEHYAHYDAGFIYPNDEYRTLKSMVIYLTTNENAATRFIKDNQEKIDIWNRVHNDWSRPVTDNEILCKSECIAGNILIFDHRLCHDVQKYIGDQPRIIIRGDIVYKLNIFI